MVELHVHTQVLSIDAFFSLTPVSLLNVWQADEASVD